MKAAAADNHFLLHPSDDSGLGIRSILCWNFAVPLEQKEQKEGAAVRWTIVHKRRKFALALAPLGVLVLV